MTKPLSLKELVSQRTATSNTVTLYLNLKTGDMRMITELEEMEYGGAEFDADLEEAVEEANEELEKEEPWQAVARKEYQEVKESPDWVEVPTLSSREAHDVMERFAVTQSSEIQELLLTAIEGKGAFRRFRDSIARLKIEKAWYAFELECLKEDTIRWLEDNEIPYVD